MVRSIGNITVSVMFFTFPDCGMLVVVVTVLIIMKMIMMLNIQLADSGVYRDIWENSMHNPVNHVGNSEEGIERVMTILILSC